MLLESASNIIKILCWNKIDHKFFFIKIVIKGYYKMDQKKFINSYNIRINSYTRFKTNLLDDIKQL